MGFVVEVPATLSNLGSGFDVVGMAVGLVNSWDFEESRSFSAGGIEVDPQGHLVLFTAVEAARRFGFRLKGLSVRVIDEEVPRSRGLGSSATARVAGLVAALRIAGREVPIGEQVGFLVDQEGHPDNVTPALVGGLVICAREGDRWLHRKLGVPGYRVALCVPEVKVGTPEARAALPANLSRDEVVYQTSRLAFLLQGLASHDDEAVRIGVQDKLHQAYRAPLIGPVEEALAAARLTGAAGAFVSGSGSTLAALVRDEGRAQEVADAMLGAFKARAMSGVSRVVTGRNEGARVT
jgi:homoserine kinase